MVRTQGSERSMRQIGQPLLIRLLVGVGAVALLVGALWRCGLPPHPCVRCLADAECPTNGRCAGGFCRQEGDLHLCRAVSSEQIEDIPEESGNEGVCRPGIQRECYTGPSGTLAVAACKAGVQICETNGRWGECLGEVLPQKEVCNDIDDDCDGNVDEGFQQKGALCQVGRGDCLATGRLVCDANGQDLRCDAKPGVASAEVCDNKDNDCDGLVDQDVFRPCYQGPADTKDKGICRSGVEICTNGVWGPCLGERTPQVEQCNGLDDDCNGQIDEIASCSCTAGQSRECFGGDPDKIGKGVCKRGIQVCDQTALRWGPCIGEVTPQPERCDSFDNNCDGSIDESDPLVGTACFLADRKGRCQEGKWACVGGALTCQQAVQPTTEICNGVDDDCNGLTDEDDPQRGDVCQVFNRQGLCALGRLRCEKGQRLCEQIYKPQPEICNGLDDNCDGKIDEQCSWALAADGDALRVEDLQLRSNGELVWLVSFQEKATLLGRPQTNVGGRATAVIKVTTDGTLQWINVLGLAKAQGGGDTVLRSLAIDDVGNLYLVGWFTGQTQIDQTRLTARGDKDVLLVSLNDRGKLNWAQSLGAAQREEATSVVWDKKAGLFVAGVFQGQTDLGGRTLNSGKNSEDIWVARFFGQGQIDWINTVSGDSDAAGALLALDQDSKLYLTGEFVNVARFSEGFNLNSYGGAQGRDVFVAQLSAAGGFLWAKVFGGEKPDALASLSTGLGSVYLGLSFVDDLKVNAQTTFQQSGEHAAVLLVDNKGIAQWTAIFGGKGSSRLFGTNPVQGGMVAVGVFRGELQVGSLRLSGPTDKDAMWWARFDVTGGVTWLRMIQSSQSIEAQRVVVDTVGNLYLTGSFSGNVTFDKTTLQSKNNANNLFLVKSAP